MTKPATTATTPTVAIHVNRGSGPDQSSAATAPPSSVHTQASDGVPTELDPLQIEGQSHGESQTRTRRTTICDAARNFFLGSTCRGGVTGGLVVAALSTATEAALLAAMRADIPGGLTGMAGPTFALTGGGILAGAGYGRKLGQRRATA